ncbi:MAG: hypothetical protein ACJ77K_01235 [Bacteroidia bacterium]
MNVIEIRAFSTWLDDNGICYTVVKPNAVISIEDAVQNTASVKEVSEGKIYPLLVNLKEINSISKEARDHFTMQNRKPGVNSIGLLIKSPVSRIIGNFFLGLNKSTVPVKLFTDETKAVSWLKQYSN